jgi:uncharacterized repeat protein (TIGR03843 family)
MDDRPGSEAVAADRAAILRLLEHGDLSVEGRLIDASNATLFCTVTLDGVTAECIHKPIAGERPLWDFPEGTLANREVAAYAVSEATGWDIVPPTVMRDGPFGPGMCQLWIDVDESVDLVALARSDHPQLRRIAVFDAVVNNADRKGGHLLPTVTGHVYGVDHGVCFSVDEKLRTILWQWRDRPLPDEAVEVLRELQAGLTGRDGHPSVCITLRQLLAPEEVDRTLRRVRRLLRRNRFPLPSEDWPPIPWPPF